MTLTDKLKHTPGPWLFDPAYAQWGQVVRGESIGVIASAIRHGHPHHTKDAGNNLLLALAPTAPHHCADPNCPGDINRRKLEAIDEMRQVMSTVLTIYPHFAACHSLRQAADVENPPACDCWQKRARAALAATEGL